MAGTTASTNFPTTSGALQGSSGSGNDAFLAKHDKLDDKQRKEASQFYGGAAMKLLREAVSKGYKDVAHMQKDTDLEPLRQRGDFRKLVAELEGKGK